MDWFGTNYINNGYKSSFIDNLWFYGLQTKLHQVQTNALNLSSILWGHGFHKEEFPKQLYEENKMLSIYGTQDPAIVR